MFFSGAVGPEILGGIQVDQAWLLDPWELALWKGLRFFKEISCLQPGLTVLDVIGGAGLGIVQKLPPH